MTGTPLMAEATSLRKGVGSAEVAAEEAHHMFPCSSSTTTAGSVLLSLRKGAIVRTTMPVAMMKMSLPPLTQWVLMSRHGETGGPAHPG